MVKVLLLNRNYRRSVVLAEDGLPIPPYDLILSVSGTLDDSWFIKGEQQAIESIMDTMERIGLDADDFQEILDFGCGCGIVIRHWRLTDSTQIHGTDFNPKAIRWCERNLSFAHFNVNRLIPPLRYHDSQFSFIYALSVFTHIPEHVQNLWMDELNRVLMPNGFLLITTHGDHYFEELTPEEQEQFRAGNLVVRYKEAAGTNLCCTYHPYTYVGKKLAKHYEIVDAVPEGAKGNPHQDLYLLRKTDDQYLAKRKYPTSFK